MRPIFQESPAAARAVRKALALACAALLCLACLAPAAPAHAQAVNSYTGRADCGGDLSAEDRLHCENVLLDAADEELNRAYQAAMDILDPKAAIMLRSAQRAWIAYRDMNYEAFSAATPGAGQSGMADRVRELRLLTRQRAEELHHLMLLATTKGAAPAQPAPEAQAPSAVKAAPVPEPAPQAQKPVTPQPPEAELRIALDTTPKTPPAPAQASPAPEPPAPMPKPEPPAPKPAAPPAPAQAPVAAPAPEPAAPASPKITDQETLQQLLGRHQLRLQWLSNVPAGTVEVVRHNSGAIRISGHQGAGLNALTVEGLVTAVRQDEFVMQGEVSIRVGYLGGGTPCVRKGVLVFSRKAGRPFWRMQSISSPCTGVSDYVDILTDHEP